MKIGNTHIIKFTKEDIEQVYLQSHRWDTWAEIKLKSGSDIRCHSGELDMIIKDKYKSYVAFCTHTHYWVSNNNGEDEDPQRYINIVKNKLSGYHGIITCNLDYKTARYTA